MPQDTMLSTEELGRLLRQEYEEAPEWEKGARVILFGITYAEHTDRRAIKIARAAGLGAAYGNLLAQGRQLAPYVTVKSPDSR